MSLSAQIIDQRVSGIVEQQSDVLDDELRVGVEDGEVHGSLVQGKYKTDLGGDAAFPENGIARMIDAIGALFDPARPVRLNPRWISGSKRSDRSSRTARSRA